jgi:ribosomal protein L5
MFFYNKIFYWKLLSKMRSSHTPQIQKILISINIRDLKDIENSIVSRVFYLLEAISGQKSYVYNYRQSSLQKKNINITGQLTLRGDKIYNFIDFFFFFIIPELKKNFIKIMPYTDAIGNFSIIVKSDGDIFSGFLGEIYMHYPIKIDFILTNTDKEKTNNFFKELGFLV